MENKTNQIKKLMKPTLKNKYLCFIKTSIYIYLETINEMAEQSSIVVLYEESYEDEEQPFFFNQPKKENNVKMPIIPPTPQVLFSKETIMNAKIQPDAYERAYLKNPHKKINPCCDSSIMNKQVFLKMIKNIRMLWQPNNYSQMQNIITGTTSKSIEEIKSQVLVPSKNNPRFSDDIQFVRKGSIHWDSIKEIRNKFTHHGSTYYEVSTTFGKDIFVDSVAFEYYRPKLILEFIKQKFNPFENLQEQS